MLIKIFMHAILIFTLLSFPITTLAQQGIIDGDQYQIGPDEKLLIRVHIFGEVKSPGEYLVPDKTNLLELISKAGGPTEFSNLRKVKITRGLSVEYLLKGDQLAHASSNYNNAITNKKFRKRVIKINLNKFLDDEDYSASIPTLRPGDVIRVGRNRLFTWQNTIRVVSQLAIIAQVWYWYSRAD